MSDAVLTVVVTVVLLAMLSWGEHHQEAYHMASASRGGDFTAQESKDV